MKPELIELSFWQLGTAGLLVVVSAVISLLLQLDLHRRLLLAVVRMTVQLLLVGLVLRWVFAPDRQWYVVISLIMAMTLVAGVVAVGRSDRRYRGMMFDSVISIWACAWLVGVVVLVAVVRPDPWFLPRYAIPLVGMILNNMLNGVSLGLNRFTNELSVKRGEIETLLALGATRWEAARGPIQQSIRTGMIPLINTMMVLGIVSLPGMMTGQLLAGADPIQAVMYQIVIMFCIGASTAMGTSAVILAAYRRLFTADHQFLPGRLLPRR